MAAERDTQQGMTFIYSNFYQLYRQGKLQASNVASANPVKGQILQTRHHVDTPVPAEVSVVNSQQEQEYAQFVSRSSKASTSHTRTGTETNAVTQGLREHLRSLREIRQRLKFLTNELDELLKRS
jgi:hypothetical protein